jgi:ABC-2 type transport system permease protein
MEKILDNFPEAFKNALGLSSMNLSEVLGFYGFMFVYIGLTGAIQAMNLGLSILSNELIDKTADFLLAKPIKRLQIVHAKLQAVLINILFTNIVFTITAKIALDVVSEEPYSMKIFLLFNLSLLLIQLFFVSLGMLVSVFLDKMKSIVPVSLGIVFAFFVVNLLNESLTDHPLSALTPFAYFATGQIYESGQYQMGLFALNIVLVIGFTIGAYVRYIKKDIPSV